jgi:hypothetical protein
LVRLTDRRTTVAEEFDVRGGWSAFQSNGWVVRFTMDQTTREGTNERTQLSGLARGTHPTVSEAMNGLGKGTVSVGPGASGHQFSFTVDWGNIKARYDGTFGLDKRITGVSFDASHPSAPQVTWISDKTFDKFPPPP